MTPPGLPSDGLPDAWERLRAPSLLEAIANRRSRRFALGMELNGGPFAYRSRHAPIPLTQGEEAVLAFAAAGLTGFVLGELPYASGGKPEAGSGNIMAGLVGRTIASPDALHNVALFVLNDEGTFLLKPPHAVPRGEVAELVHLGREGRFETLYERSRIQVGAERADIPREVPYVPPFNKWSANVPGATYFLPVNDLTAVYVNILLSALSEEFAYFILDERAGFRPAGVGRFARSKGGHLHDDPRAGRVVTVQGMEAWLLELTAVEQGFMIQNLALATEAMGLGGFPHFAAHPHAWFQALGFRMGEVSLARTLGAGGLKAAAMRLLGRNPVIPVPLGLGRGGETLLRPYCPPNYASMAAAVRALVDSKFAGGGGIFRDGSDATAWKETRRVQAGIPAYSDAAIAATIAYCDYVHGRYGRFPGTFGPFRTVLAFQAHHLDLEFYDRFFKPGATTDAHRQHFAAWHPGVR